MSDVEEPPAKVTKYEMSQTYTQPEEMDDDAQEEWLSEELLTDDDCNPATLQDHSESGLGNVSQNSNSQDLMDTSQDSSMKVDDSNIEQELNQMDNEEQDDLPDELETFLIRKPDPKPVVAEKEDTDGNDTDDLLRMLEDDDKSKKKVKKTASERPKQVKRDESSDEDDFVYQGVKTRLQVAKTVLMKKLPATKAEPELSSDQTDASSDEAKTVKKMFDVRKPGNFAAKSTARPNSGTPKPHSATPKPHTDPAKPHIDTPRPNSNNVKKPTILKRSSVPMTSTPLKTYTNKAKHDKSTSKTPDSQRRASQPASQPSKDVRIVKKVITVPKKKKIIMIPEKQKMIMAPEEKKITTVPEEKKVITVPQKVEISKETDKSKKEFDEIINEEEFLEDEHFDLDEDFALESDSDLDNRASMQRIMKPEQLDEEMYSDAESQPDDDSLYDELPSSDSDDIEDWFNLDIRSERAGDYLPLLGSRAYDLLQDEKKRLTRRLESLRARVTSLSEVGDKRASRLRAATAALQHVRDMIKTA